MEAMKCSFLSILIVTLSLVAQTANADLITCDFSNLSDATIRFTGTGRLIEFPSTGLRDFVVTDATSPNLGGLQGNIDGTFVVGLITVTGTMEQASVTTTDGLFSIDDGHGNTLKADLDWKDILVYTKMFGFMNILGDVNLANVTYAGSNTDLLAIKNGGDQSVVLSFTFSPVAKKSLVQLMTPGEVNSTSYSGSLSAVPEPSSCVLLGMAAFGLLTCAVRRRLS
jgi:hypothetical protein